MPIQRGPRLSGPLSAQMRAALYYARQKRLKKLEEEEPPEEPE